jgi:hypothetical protein
MTKGLEQRLAWVLFGLTVLSFLGAVSVVLARPEDDSSPAIVLAIGAFILAFAIVGLLVSTRQPRNPLGWIMAAAGLAYALMSVASVYGEPYATDPASALPGSGFALWLSNWAWITGVAPAATFLLLLFPTGRLPSRRWRPVAWLAGVGLAMALPGLAFTEGKLEGYEVENPVGIPGASAGAGIGLLLLALAAAAAIASLVVRWRRARSLERQQLKLLIFAGALVGFAILLIPGLDAVGASSDDVTNSVMSLALAAVPIAIGVAILRHRLYDIDVVINRTLVYAGVTATLAAAYLGSVLLLQLILTPSSDLAVAGSTLAVAALFRPARARMQSTVDRRFYRRRYDAQRTLAGFGVRVRDEVDLDALGRDLRGIVSDTLQPAHVSLWMRPR